MSWQRRARLGLVAFMIVFAVAVFYALRERETPVKAKPVPPPPPGVVAEVKGADAVHLKGSRQDVTILSAASRTYTDGRTELEHVQVTIGRRAGRTFVITGRRAEITEDRTRFSMTGAVKIVSNDGLTVASESIAYNEGDGLVRFPGPVEFTRGATSGSSTGATYDRNRDHLSLHRNARINMPAEGGAIPVEIQSATAEIARRDNYMHFDGGTRIVRGERTIEAQTALARMQPGTQKLEQIELHGAARITSTETRAGALRGMSANDINLTYGPDGNVVKHAVLAGAGGLELAGDGAASRRLSSELLDLQFADDGTTVTQLVAREQVRLEIPAEGNQGPRTVTAPRLESFGDAGGLTSARFLDGAEYRETAVAADGKRSERIATAQTIELAMKPGFSTIEDAKFIGNFRFADGSLRASGDEARYGVGRGTLDLIPVPNRTRPRVTDGSTSIEAGSIGITLEGRKLVGDQEVRTEYRSDAAGAQKEDTKLPGLLESGQPAYVSSKHLEYEGEAGRAVYTGAARLWQGETTIQANRITLDRKSGNLTATGSPRSVMIAEEVNEKTKARERVRTTASAQEIHYDDAPRKITYVGKAHVTGSQGDLTADRVELYLGRAGEGLQRVEGYDTVTVRLEGRSSTGKRMTYFAPEGRYLMTGSPVKITEACRVTTGQTLTFFRSTDTILVDGSEERTHTTGAGCPEKSPQ